MIRNSSTENNCRPLASGRARRIFRRLGMIAFALISLSLSAAYAQEAIVTQPAAPQQPVEAPADAPPGDAGATPAQKKIVNNPFTPGGVTTTEQTITRKEVMKLIADMESRLRKELSGDINTDEINKLIMNAAGGQNGAPMNFIGCVNGVPLYRDEEGSLTMGTKEPEEMKKQRCGS